MPSFKLGQMKELFPEVNKQLMVEDRKKELGMMFDLDESEKKKVVATVIEMADEMARQREGLMAIREESVKNYEGIEKFNGPWEGSSNISTMVTTIACDAMHSKLFPMIWNIDMLHFEGVDKHDEVVARNNVTLMKWALTKDMEGTQDKVDDAKCRYVTSRR